MEDLDFETIISKVESHQKSTNLEDFIDEVSSEYGYLSCCVYFPSTEGGKQPVYLGGVSRELKSWIEKACMGNSSLEIFSFIPVTLDKLGNMPCPNAFIINISPLDSKKAYFFIEVGGDIENEALKNLSRRWSVIGPYLNKLALSYRKEPLEKQLTKREQECMHWVSKGKTSWEVSTILGISERTVNFHIQNCMRKTNSSNRQHATFKYLISKEVI